MNDKRKTTQADVLRLVKKSVEVHAGKRKWTEATQTSYAESVLEYVEDQVEGASRGGRKTAKRKKADLAARNRNIIDESKKLARAGKPQRNIPSILAKRRSLSARQIKRIIYDEE